MGDFRDYAVTSVVIPGSTGVGATQAMLAPLNPAAGKCTNLGEG